MQQKREPETKVKDTAHRAAATTVGVIGGAAIGFVAFVVGMIANKDPYDPTPLGLYLKWHFHFGITLFALMLVGGLFGLWITRARWTLVGTLLYMSLMITVTGFILYSATVMLPKRMSIINVSLFLAESLSLMFVVLYAYYTIDRVSRRQWTRHFALMPRTPNVHPKLEFHVPVYNEPPHVVMETIDCLLRMDYPKEKFSIVVADDSTDEDARAEIERFCHDHDELITYVHRENRRGYKAGALNEVLRKTPEDVELIAIVDADYKVEPAFLKETVGYFEENPELGFVQTPQDFHNVDYSDFTRQIYRANKFFYDAIMPARNEVNSIIFCGTMGIVRRRALEEAGAWGEDVLTEDAETSLRISECGWQSLYVPKVYGRGLLPQSFSAYKSQQYRWAFGGVQILRKHGLKLFKSRLSGRQRMDLISGGLHYFSGVFLAVIAFILLLFGISDLLGVQLTNFHRGEIWLMGLVPFFIMVEGVLRMRWALGKTMGLNFKETMEVLGVWFSVSMINALAAVRAMVGSKQAFVRTPKYRARKVSAIRSWVRGVALTKFESTIAWWLGITGVGILLLALWNIQYILSYGILTITTSFVLAFWLIWYAYVFGCAPLYAARGSRGPV